MNIIGVPNLKEIETQEDQLKIFVILHEEVNVKKIRQFSGTNTSRNTMITMVVVQWCFVSLLIKLSIGSKNFASLCAYICGQFCKSRHIC